MHHSRLQALALALALLSSFLCRPLVASQATLVTPGSPLPMTGLAAFLNAAFLSIGSCNSGTTAPTNGTAGAAFAEECWANTTGAPSSIPFAYYDGAQWVTFGTLNATAHTWTPYFGANPTIEAAPLAGSLSSGVLTIALQYDSNFTNNGSSQLAFANIAGGSLLANSTGSSAEPTATTPTAWLNQWCSGTQFNFPQRGASSWACGSISGLLIAGTGVTLSGTGQVTIGLTNQLTAGGPIGGAATIPIITYNAQGQLTAVSSVVANPTQVNGNAWPSAGTSGGIPYFSGANAIAASALLTQYGVMIGGGAGGAPATIAKCSDAQIILGQIAAPSCQTMGGDATITDAGTLTIGTGAVSYAKMQNVTASRLLGNPTASAAAPSEISLGASLAFSGSALQTGAGTGDVTWAANSFATTIAANAVTNAKAAQMAATTIKGNPTGAAANAQDVAPATARSASLLNIDACTSTGSSAYSIAATDRCVYHTSLTAAVTDTLPAANSFNAGQRLYVVDFRGVASATNTITLQRSGSDTINGSASAVAINSQYGWSVWMSDGASRWTYQQGGSGGGSGTVTSVGIAAGAATTASGTCTITTSGTCTIAGRLFQYFVITSSNPAWNIAANFGYTPSELFIEAWGGGASGSGQNGGASTSRGSGGGGGQYAFDHYAGTMDTTLNISIGAGGTSCSSACGGVGGGLTSVVGTNLGTVSAAGGGGSGCSGGPCAGGAGGIGGSAPQGFVIVGQAGGATPAVQNVFGSGGDAPRGGQGGKVNIGAAGACPGGGGAGENHTGGGSGAGCAGEVIIWGR